MRAHEVSAVSKGVAEASGGSVICCPGCGERPAVEFSPADPHDPRRFRRIRGPLGIIRLVRHDGCGEITFEVLR